MPSPVEARAHMHSQSPPAALPKRRIKLLVGGTRFDVNSSTLQSAGNASLLAQLAENAFTEKLPEVFLDRDPELFSALLFVLRSRKLPSKMEAFDIDQLIDEAEHYGMLEILKAAMAPPRLDGLDIEKIGALFATGRDFPSALACGPDGSLYLGHGNKITFYDWALRRHHTTLTDFCDIQSLSVVSENRVAVGAADKAGLHVFNVWERKPMASIMWIDAQDPRVLNPSVHAIASTPTAIFASFGTARGGDNTIAFVDPETLEIVADMGRQRGVSSLASTKLEWMEKRGLLVAGSTVAGPLGHTGHLRLFDVRRKEQVWGWKEPNMTVRPQDKDSFADWATAEELDAVFKICVASGELEVLELRMMNEKRDPWLLMEETRPSLAKGEGGAANLLTVSGRQVFCSRGGDLEVWSEVPLHLGPGKDSWERPFRRNYMEQRRNNLTITAIATGGNRLCVARKDLQGVEVWETRRMYRH